MNITNIINNIDYNTLKKIKRNSYNLYLASLALSFSSNENIKITGLTLEIISFLISLTLINDNIFIKAKDIIEINKLYNEFLTNYNKLQNNFEFYNPNEIYAMFNFSYTNGFLSKNSEFKYSKNSICDNKFLYSHDIINGRGVCRHLSSMLKDIYDKSDIENHILTTFMQKYAIEYEKTEIPKYTISQMNDTINSLNIGNHKKNILTTLINENNGKLDLIIKEKNKSFFKKTGNHVINMIKYNDVLYFYDPTNLEILKYNGNFFLTDNDDLKTKIVFNPFSDINNHKNTNYKTSKEQIIKNLNELKQSDIFINKVTYNNALLLCKENLDMFYDFYNQNKEIYSEISNKLLKLKK